MGLYDLGFYDIIRRNSVTYAGQLCWQEVDDGRELTFAQYREQVEKLAAGLASAGLKKGDRIGVVGKNSLEFFLLYGAAAFLGAVMLPINWRLSSEEMVFNLNDCTPKLLFADQEFQESLEQKKPELTCIKAWFNLKAGQGDFEDFSTLLQGEISVEPAEVGSADGFVIIHTAAVAGRPRGALLSHGNMLLANLHFHSEMELSRNRNHLNLLPLFHVGGLFLAAATFHSGGGNVNLSKFEARGAVKLIKEKEVSHLFDFPPILSSILEAAKEEQVDISSLQAVIGLGTPEVIEQFQEQSGGTYYVFYGQTETSCLTTISSYDESPGSAGKMIGYGDVQLVNEDDRPVSIGEVGEICLKGPMVFQGYWGLEQDNEYTFREGWHHTGDLGRLDARGYLFYAGRKAEKELIKPGGENVYPAEVEKVILQHPAVARTAVIGVPDPKWKEGIKAVCQLVEGQSLEKQALIDFVGERIARFKKPQYVEFVEVLPLNEDGSIDREKVKADFGSA